MRPSRSGGFLRGLGALARYWRQRPDCVWLQYGSLPDLAYLIMAKALTHAGPGHSAPWIELGITAESASPGSERRSTATCVLSVSRDDEHGV
jgi:hypothetical protein